MGTNDHRRASAQTLQGTSWTADHDNAREGQLPRNAASRLRRLLDGGWNCSTRPTTWSPAPHKLRDTPDLGIRQALGDWLEQQGYRPGRALSRERHDPPLSCFDGSRHVYECLPNCRMHLHSSARCCRRSWQDTRLRADCSGPRPSNPLSGEVEHLMSWSPHRSEARQHGKDKRLRRMWLQMSRLLTPVISPALGRATVSGNYASTSAQRLRWGMLSSCCWMLIEYSMHPQPCREGCDRLSEHS